MNNALIAIANEFLDSSESDLKLQSWPFAANYSIRIQ